MTKDERAEMLALMQEAVQPINSRLDKIEQDIADVKQVQRNSAVFEDDMKKKTGILLDTVKGIQDRFDRQDALEGKVEDLQNRMTAVEYKLKQA